jgi:hypothetical protein
MTSNLECWWPDYDTTFTFSVKYKGKTLWDDDGKMPLALRLLLNSAINTLDPDSTLGETVEAQLEPRPQDNFRLDDNNTQYPCK